MEARLTLKKAEEDIAHVQIMESHAVVESRLATAYGLCGDRTQASLHLDRARAAAVATNTEGQRKFAFSIVGSAAARIGDVDRARKLLAGIDSSSQTFRVDLAEAIATHEARGGHFEAAKQTLDQVVRKEPVRLVEIAERTGRIAASLVASGHKDEAIRWARAQDFTFAKAHALYSAAHAMLGKVPR